MRFCGATKTFSELEDVYELSFGFKEARSTTGPCVAGFQEQIADVDAALTFMQPAILFSLAIKVTFPGWLTVAFS